MLDDPIVVVPYDPRWPQLFEEERAHIEGAIGTWTLEMSESFRDDWEAYTDAKTDFIRERVHRPEKGSRV